MPAMPLPIKSINTGILSKQNKPKSHLHLKDNSHELHYKPFALGTVVLKLQQRNYVRKVAFFIFTVLSKAAQGL